MRNTVKNDIALWKKYRFDENGAFSHILRKLQSFFTITQAVKLFLLLFQGSKKLLDPGIHTA